MARKRLIIFDHHGTGHESITEPDYASFYTTLLHASIDIPDLSVESFDILAIDRLNAKVKTLIDDQGSDELFFPINDFQILISCQPFLPSTPIRLTIFRR